MEDMTVPEGDYKDIDYSSQYESYEGEELNLDSADLLGEFVQKGLVGDRYCNMDEIARGGMGVIYKVRDAGLDRQTVLKVINPELISNGDLLTRFIEEARITGQLEHPNIVPVHDIGVLGGEQLYFSMKCIEGQELREILDSIEGTAIHEPPYTLFTLLTIFRKVCDAVSFAHSKNVVHRDIKPDNVLVGNYGEVLLVDWGLARRLDQPEEALSGFESGFLTPETSGSVTRTRFGVIKGTPAFMAPEMAKGEVDNVDFTSDIFLLGATLYAIATLEAPFTDNGPDDIYKILQRAENCVFLPPSERAPERQIPAELERIIMKALEPEQCDRYQTVNELIEDIDALMEGRAQSERRYFDPGEHLMREGESGDEAYVILNGQAEVYKTINGKPATLVVLGAGSTVGEMALIDNSPRSASVVAKTETEVSVINQETLRQLLDKMPPWLGRTVGSLTGRLRNTNANIHPLLNEDCVYQVMNMIRLLYPFCGQTAELEDHGELIVLNVEDTLLEMAVQLSLPAEKILGAVTRVIRTNLVQAVNEDYFCVPNFNLFCRFLNYVGEATGTPTAVSRERRAEFFDANGVLTVTFSNVDVEMEGEEELSKASELELLGCETEAQVDECFSELYQLLMEPLEE